MKKLIAAAAASILGSTLFGDLILTYRDSDDMVKEHFATWPIPVDEETAKEVADLHLLSYRSEKLWVYKDSIPVTTNVNGTVVTIGYILNFNDYNKDSKGQLGRPINSSIGITLGIPNVKYDCFEVIDKETRTAGKANMNTFLKYIAPLNIRDNFNFLCPTPQHWLYFESTIKDPRWRSMLIAGEEYKSRHLNYFILALPFVWDVPEAVDDLKYDGTEKTGVIPTGSYYLTGNKATEPGDYVAIATISNNVGCFFGGSIDPIRIPWSIAP